MKKIYESQLNGWDESAERIHIYALENDDEYWKFSLMNHSDKCDYFEVWDEYGCMVAPGAMYKTYEFHTTKNYITITETVSYNV